MVGNYRFTRQDSSIYKKNISQALRQNATSRQAIDLKQRLYIYHWAEGRVALPSLQVCLLAACGYLTPEAPVGMVEDRLRYTILVKRIAARLTCVYTLTSLLSF